MPTSTEELRANKSADARVREWADRLAKAKLSDQRMERPDDKRQWGVLVGWLLSESKKLDPADRRLMFDHLLTVARQMNDATRKVSQYTHGGR